MLGNCQLPRIWDLGRPGSSRSLLGTGNPDARQLSVAHLGGLGIDPPKCSATVSCRAFGGVGPQPPEMLGNCQLPSVWEGRGYGNGSWPSVSGGWAPTPRNARQLSVAERLGGSGPRSPYEVCSDIADQTPPICSATLSCRAFGGGFKIWPIWSCSTHYGHMPHAAGGLWPKPRPCTVVW